MKTSTLLLLLGLGCALALAAYEATLISAQHAEIAALTGEAAKERTATVLFERNQKCADQAKKVFSASGYSSVELAGYGNHYSAKLNKCFVEIESSMASGGIPTTYRSILDAFESKEYGRYFWINRNGAPFSEVAPTKCEVLLASGETKTCHSNEEFSALIKVYMED